MISDMRTKALVFAVGCPDPRELPPPTECIIVPLYSELVLDPKFSAWTFENTFEILGIEDHQQVLVESEEIWKSFLLNGDIPELADYSNFFFIAITPILFWKRLIRKAISRHMPLEIIIPIECKSPKVTLGSDLFNERDSFLKFMAYLILERECKSCNLNISYVPELNLKRKNLFLGIKEKVLKAYSVASSVGLSELFQKIVKCLTLGGSSRRAMEGSSDVLIISQAPKTERLRKELTLRKLDVSQVDYANFIKYFTSKNDFDCPLIHLDANTGNQSYDEILNLWISSAVEFHRNFIHNRIEKWVDLNTGIILTDGEYHYFIRKLMRSLEARKKQFFILPEGVVNFTSMDQIRAESILGNRGSFCCRVIVSNYQFRVYEKIFNSDEIRVIGGYFFSYESYFTKSRKYSPLIGSNKLLMGIKPIVFLDIYLFNVNGIERPIYHLPFDQQLKIIDLFLEALDLEKYDVVSNLRHSNFLELLQIRYRGKITFFVNVNWLFLARYSTLIVTRSSSICAEALFLKIPVLIWNPFPEFPDIFESFEYKKSSVLQRATNKHELASCIEVLNHNLIEDFDVYAEYIPDEAAINSVMDKILSASNPSKLSQPF